MSGGGNPGALNSSSMGSEVSAASTSMTVPGASSVVFSPQIPGSLYLTTELRTCGRHLRYVHQEVFPWESYSNNDGFLT